MTSPSPSFAHLSDNDLLATVKRLARTECRATAALVRSLMELDARRLYLGEGYSSLFTYCTQALHLAEGAAYNRIAGIRTRVVLYKRATERPQDRAWGRARGRLPMASLGWVPCSRS